MLLEGLSFMSGDILTHVLCFVCGDETRFRCSGPIEDGPLFTPGSTLCE